MNQIPSAVYVTIATSVVLAIMYGVTKRTGFFTRHQKVHESKTLEELNKEYAKWDVLSRFVYFGLAALCTYSAFLPLKYIAGRFQPPVSEGILYFYASNSYWLVTALFSGLFLAIIPMYVLSKLLPSDRMHEYDCYMDMKAGVNLNRLGLVFSVMMILLLTVMIFFGLRFYWVFEKKEFALNPVTRLTGEPLGGPYHLMLATLRAVEVADVFRCLAPPRSTGRWRCNCPPTGGSACRSRPSSMGIVGRWRRRSARHALIPKQLQRDLKGVHWQKSLVPPSAVNL